MHPSLDDSCVELEEALEALKLLREPNETIPGFEVPSKTKIDSWIETTRSLKSELSVTSLADLTSKILIPDITEEYPSIEHLTTYHKLSRVKLIISNMLEMLRSQNTLEYRFEYKALSAELENIRSQAESMERNILLLKAAVETRGSGISIQAGFISVELDAIAETISALNQSISMHVKISVSNIWNEISTIANRVRDICLKILRFSKSTSDTIKTLVGKTFEAAAALVRGGAALSAKARSLVEEDLIAPESAAPSEAIDEGSVELIHLPPAAKGIKYTKSDRRSEPLIQNLIIFFLGINPTQSISPEHIWQEFIQYGPGADYDVIMNCISIMERRGLIKERFGYINRFYIPKNIIESHFETAKGALGL